MSYQLQPGAGFIFMKVGVHAQETLADIIARKQRELKDAGVSGFCWRSAVEPGRSTGTSTVASGAATMKMISSTNITSM